MSEYLTPRNCPCASKEEEARLAGRLESIIAHDLHGNVLGLLGRFESILQMLERIQKEIVHLSLGRKILRTHQRPQAEHVSG